VTTLLEKRRANFPTSGKVKPTIDRHAFADLGHRPPATLRDAQGRFWRGAKAMPARKRGRRSTRENWRGWLRRTGLGRWRAATKPELEALTVRQLRGLAAKRVPPVVGAWKMTRVELIEALS
jgi:hypothetical protein